MTDERQQQDDDLYQIVSTALDEADFRRLTRVEIDALRFVCSIPAGEPQPNPQIRMSL